MTVSNAGSGEHGLKQVLRLKLVNLSKALVFHFHPFFLFRSPCSVTTFGRNSDTTNGATGKPRHDGICQDS